MAIADLINGIRSIDRLLGLEVKHGAAIDKLLAEIDALKTRILRLETREDVIIAEAKAAAGTAATQVAIASVSELARRIGRIEERTDRTRLPPPPNQQP